MYIDSSLLVRLKACSDQRYVFSIVFPDGLDVTGEPDNDVFKRIGFHELDVNWLCQQVFTASAKAERARLVNEAWAEYKRVEAPAWAEYQRVAAMTWADFRCLTAPALAEYERAVLVATWRILSDPNNIRPEYRQ